MTIFLLTPSRGAMWPRLAAFSTVYERLIPARRGGKKGDCGLVLVVPIVKRLHQEQQDDKRPPSHLFKVHCGSDDRIMS